MILEKDYPDKLFQVKYDKITCRLLRYFRLYMKNLIIISPERSEGLYNSMQYDSRCPDVRRTPKYTTTPATPEKIPQSHIT